MRDFSLSNQRVESAVLAEKKVKTAIGGPKMLTKLNF